MASPAFPDPPIVYADRAHIVAGIAGAVIALLAGENITSVRQAVTALSAGAGVAVFLVPWLAELVGVSSPNAVSALSFFSGLTGLQVTKLMMRYGPRAAFEALAQRLGVTLPKEQE